RPRYLSYLSTPFPSSSLCFFQLTPRPPTSPLFPYTTLFRSQLLAALALPLAAHHRPQRALEPGDGLEDRAEQVVALRLVVRPGRSEEHTSELQSLTNLVCRLLLEKKTLHKTLRRTVLYPRQH